MGFLRLDYLIGFSIRKTNTCGRRGVPPSPSILSRIKMVFRWWDLKRDASHCEKEDARHCVSTGAVVWDLMVFDEW